MLSATSYAIAHPSKTHRKRWTFKLAYNRIQMHIAYATHTHVASICHWHRQKWYVFVCIWRMHARHIYMKTTKAFRFESQLVFRLCTTMSNLLRFVFCFVGWFSEYTTPSDDGGWNASASVGWMDGENLQYMHIYSMLLYMCLVKVC